MRALLHKPAALGAAIGLAFFGVAVLLVSTMAAHASVTTASTTSSVCGSPPTTSTVLTSSNEATTGGGTSLSTSALASSADSSITDDNSPGPTPTDTDTTTPADPPSSPDSPTATTSDTSTSSSTDAAATSPDVSSTDQSPGGTPTPDPSSSDSPTPEPSSSVSSAPTPQLCVLVQSYPSSADVLAGDQASYVVWAWSMTADSSDVSITASVPAASYLGTPSFTICPSASDSTCTIASLPVGQVYELLASVPVTTDAPLGTDIELTVTATATGATSDSSSATDDVVAPTTASASDTSNASSDGLSGEVPPLVSLPPIPGTGVTATNPSDLFPTVSPSQDTQSLGLRPAKSRRIAHTADAAYAVPIDPRLLGAQIVGLMALVGAVTIAIVRLSLRKPQLAQPPKADPLDSPPTS